jgi:hypothetical protein
MWADLEIPASDFDVAALHSAIDSRRTEHGMSWNAVAHEVNRVDERHGVHPISSSTISGLKNKRLGVEGDGVLQMLLWLDRTPESFVPGHPGGSLPEAQLPKLREDKTLRFDVPRIYSKLDRQRTARGITWVQVATEIGRFYSAESLRNMSEQRRTVFPHVMRLARWLRCPAVALTRISDW